MEKTLLLLAAVTLLGSLFLLNTNVSLNDDTVPVEVQAQFQAYKLQYNKKYGSEEANYRLQVFYENVQSINNFNQQKGEEIMGITFMADLTDQEFEAAYLTNIYVDETVEVADLSDVDVVTSVDWRQKGAVTPIKNQGQCGSCWAFSTTGVLEGFFATTKGTLPDLAEQQLVDCAGLMYGNLGCNGGMPSRALNYVKKSGLTTQDKYAYTAVKGSKCLVQGGSWKVAGQAAVPANDAALVAALSKQPVSVAVMATTWKNYKQGIFSDCTTQMNHAVLAVGFAADHYIVKNSWSTAWGEAGYIRLARGNTCGIHQAMVIPN